jgi:hypothetical protein
LAALKAAIDGLGGPEYGRAAIHEGTFVFGRSAKIISASSKSIP